MSQVLLKPIKLTIDLPSVNFSGTKGCLSHGKVEKTREVDSDHCLGNKRITKNPEMVR
jgi:hypothetical protein